MTFQSLTIIVTLAWLLLIDRSIFIEAKWNATGTVKNLWATPVMEYSGLFSEEQLAVFAKDVKKSWESFLEEKNNPVTARKTKAQAYGTSTKNDKDLINEEFFNYQSRFPVNPYTLDIVWQAFVFACNKYIEETGMPPIEYQRETLEGGSLEWTTEKNPRRGKQYCWGSVQFGGTHHDIHTHPGSALAGTIYLEVPADGGPLSLMDPRGPLPPFTYAYRVLPEAGKIVIFPGTVPHSVHGTPGDNPRVSISCNYPGDWRKFTTSNTVFGESSWSHEMMSREEAQAQAQAKHKSEL
mmetsp:Transcript_15461/g.20136  ORF Transcript_15461/g.20136 Transcript_15461/m.20136 type:complete len:295 (+) Transcript_15461:73-957(+)